MKIYQVGGAVRDKLLGLSVQDRDFLVVGATPEEMVARGFLPVGKDFPVFLHPQTHEEYALARTERKTAPGYKGFVFHTDATVTLEQDLIRRDLTINAMAVDEDGVLHDPFGGQQDLARRVLRHVSAAFAEDPVRILRLARFAARLSDFTVAPETCALMQQMVAVGEVDALVPERVWQEIERGLMEAAPVRMLAVLRECGALARLLPELLDANPSLWACLDRAAANALALPQRLAILLHQLESGAELEQLCQRLRVPNECRELAVLLQREAHLIAHVARACLHPGAAELAADLVGLFQRCDVWRKPERFATLLQACDTVQENALDFQPLLRALHAAQQLASGPIAKQFSNQPQMIPQAIYAARIDAVRQALLAEC